METEIVAAHSKRMYSKLVTSIVTLHMADHNASLLGSLSGFRYFILIITCADAVMRTWFLSSLIDHVVSDSVIQGRHFAQVSSGTDPIRTMTCV